MRPGRGLFGRRRGKKEDQYGIGPSGDLEWISLEQAGVQAMRTAREDPGNYGRTYSGVRMVFDVTEEEDGEDYYIITLSFRPEGDFSGTPGQEQFFIEKEGAVAVRQVRSLPISDRRGRSRAPVYMILGIGVVIVGVIGALFAAGVLPPGADEPTASPPIGQQGQDAVQVAVALLPGRAARLNSPQGDVTVDISAGSVDRPMELVYRELSPDEIPAMPVGFSASDKLFDLSVTGAQASTIGRFSFDKPATITVRLTAAHVEQANSEESNLVIQHFDEGGGAWTALPTTVDFTLLTARAEVESLSKFALTIRQIGEQSGTTSPGDTSAGDQISFELTVNGRQVTGPSIDTANATVDVSPPPNASNDRYITGTEVKLTLSPDSGYRGSCDTSSVFMTSDLEVGCSVTRESYTLSILGRPVTGPTLAMTEGTVNLSPAPNAPGNQYISGTVVNVSLSPASGFEGSCDTLAVTMTSDRNVSCTMTLQRFILTIESVQVLAGQITVEVANGEIDVSEAPGFDGMYAGNVELSLFAYPYSSGATIVWTGVDTEGFESATVQMSRDRFVAVDILPLDLHSDSRFGATPISAGLTSGAIDPPGDLDFFQFSAQAGSTYTIEVILDTHPDTMLIVYDSRGNWLDEDDDGGPSGGEHLEWTAPSAGEYYLEVRSFDQSFDTGSYTLSINVADAHGDSTSTATTVFLGVTSGSIDPPEDLDYFRFSAQAGITYLVEVILDSHSDTVLTLYDSRGAWLDEDDDGGRDGGESIAWTATSSGD